jgi:HEAT repeat protein
MGASLFRQKPDIEGLERNGDISRLIRLLSHRDEIIQGKAVAALVRMGDPAIKELIERIYHPNRIVRIGIIETLAQTRDKRAVGKIIDLLRNDESIEVRWISAIALGEIGDKAAIPPLIQALQDPDKYVRYGAALALDEVGWSPGTPEEYAYYLSAAQKWEELILYHQDIPARPFLHHLSDIDPSVRAHAVEVLGELRTPDAREGCSTVLKDINSEVRWKGIRAFPNCGIPLMQLPIALSQRKRERKSAFAACLLNFLFLGLGYSYLGFWWGMLLFQLNLTIIVILGLLIGPFIPYLASYAISAVVVVHTWFYVRRLPDT